MYTSIFLKFLSSQTFAKSRQLWDLINIISSTYSILTHEAMKVAGETWQRSRRILLAAGSYIQPCFD